MNWRISSDNKPLRGSVRVPGDKSITHRALILSSLAEGPSTIHGFLDSADCRATMGCLNDLGIPIERMGPDRLVVHGKGLKGYREPGRVLNCVRSGTTMRLLAGVLAGQGFYSVLSGEEQLLRRPMARIVEPLRSMGAHIHGREEGRYPPLTIIGADLVGTRHRLPVASAQVKSCLLLAGLNARGKTIVIEPGPSRDHTERMLRARGVDLRSIRLTHTVYGPVGGLQAMDVMIPGDFSSAAYLLAAALLVPGSEIWLLGIGVNPTRTGLLDALRDMGADIALENLRDEGGEPVADLYVRHQSLKATQIGGELVPRMIDEFPIMALVATQAEGVTRISDAAELRVKETDRIATTTEMLRALGAKVMPLPDGFEIEGPAPLAGTTLDSHGDHRLAMTAVIAGLVAKGETYVTGVECIEDSFPHFREALVSLGVGVL